MRWRTGRHRHPLWKSLVLPAGGVALCWLLVMTLWLPPLDYARSYRALVPRVAQHVPAGACIAAPGLPRALVAALEYFGGWRVDATAERDRLALRLPGADATAEAPAGAWQFIGRERRRAPTTT